VEQAAASWPQEGVHLQHFFAFTTLTWLDLYERPGSAAFERAETHSKALERSLIFRLPMHREYHLRSIAMAALSAWAHGDARARPMALSALARLERMKTRGSVPRHRALWAAKALIEGDREGAAAALRTTLQELQHLTIALDVPALEEALGRLVGGDEGRALRASADARIERMNVREKPRYLDMIWPAFARL
jgi:hypothetical protein